MSIARCSPDGCLVAHTEGSSGILQVHQIDQGLTLQPLVPLAAGKYHLNTINAIAWAQCSRILATAGADGLVVVWKIIYDAKNPGGSQLIPRRVLRGHLGPVTCITFDRKGVMLASGSQDQRVIVWNVKQGVKSMLLYAHLHTITAVDFSFDSKFLLTACAGGFLRIWHVLNGMSLRTINVSGYTHPVLAARFAPNGAWVLLRYSDGVTRLLSVRNQKVYRRYGARDPVINEKVCAKPLCDFVVKRPNFLFVSTERGIDLYDIQTQCHLKHWLDVPVVCLDVFIDKNFGMGVGLNGIELFTLDLDNISNTEPLPAQPVGWMNGGPGGWLNGGPKGGLDGGWQRWPFVYMNGALRGGSPVIYGKTSAESNPCLPGNA